MRLLNRRQRRPRSEGAEGTRLHPYAVSSLDISSQSLYDAPVFKFRSGYGDLAAHPFVRRRKGRKKERGRARARSPGGPREGGDEPAPDPSPSPSPSPSPGPGPGIYMPTRPGWRQPWRQPRAVVRPVQRDLVDNADAASLSSRHVESGGGEGGGSGLQVSDSSRQQPVPSLAGDSCRKCRHPSGEKWSLKATITGHGPGVRRGSDWCPRCAYRKISRAWCFCHRGEYVD
ncbi:hypothetical protein F5Y17DRAFT_427213 [Xylariaceae sp. FL0594]|nr:hypothetical protein F5Y17DRAFT_427213 [Xylariaceae sp. FL0594]